VPGTEGAWHDSTLPM